MLRLPDRVRRVLAWCGGFAGGFAAMYLFAVLSPQGQALDAPTLGSFAWSGPIGEIVGEARTPLTVALCAGAAAAIVYAVIGGRYRAAAAATAALSATYVLNTLLRDVVLRRPDYGEEFGYSTNTFPSGHTALAVAGAAVILALLPMGRVSPRVVGMIGFAAILVAVGSVASYAHRGSDVLGGALLAGTLVCGIPSASTLAPLRLTDRRWVSLAAVIVGAVVLRFAGAAADAPVVVSLGVCTAVIAGSVAVTAAVLATVVPDRSRIFP